MILRAKLPNIQVFCLTFERGSFTEAAKALGITPQAASRSVKRLENDLGVVLFRRSTRQLQPTEAGNQYYEACREALWTLERAETRLEPQESAPSGKVRISVPTTYGHHRFLPTLPEFRRNFPGIEVDVEISNHTTDFVREGFDLSIRMGFLKDASYVARKLGDFSFGVFASPSYLANAGIPETPEDLSLHQCGVFVMPRTGRVNPWVFGESQTLFRPPAMVRFLHDALGLIIFAKAGGGLIQMFRFLVERELASGELVEVLQPYAWGARPFSLLYPQEGSQRPAVQAMIHHILQHAEADAKGR